MLTVLEVANVTDYSDCFGVLTAEQLASGPTIGKVDIDGPYTISAANPGETKGRPKKTKAISIQATPTDEDKARRAGDVAAAIITRKQRLARLSVFYASEPVDGIGQGLLYPTPPNSVADIRQDGPLKMASYPI